MVAFPPEGRTPVSHSRPCQATALWGRSPTLAKVSVVPALIRTRPGTKLYSTLIAPILTVSTPLAMGPTGPATVDGWGGGHSGLRRPLSEKAQTASP